LKLNYQGRIRGIGFVDLGADQIIENILKQGNLLMESSL
jgi:hypothetical protein